ncbi:macro domain-containing protein [Terrisporobacter mayombei]|nr:macro domain-containing protein [Terrisporobacter mayombei]
MKIIEKKMNLFKLPLEYTLVHCISQDCKMGKGIAKTFDNKYPDMRKELKDALNMNDLKFPISILHHESITTHDVINMITKEKYWHKPTYNDFSQALLDVVSLCKQEDIKKLGMPKIGCGLDRLQWEKVKQIIEHHFKDLDIEIIVCYL